MRRKAFLILLVYDMNCIASIELEMKLNLRARKMYFHTHIHTHYISRQAGVINQYWLVVYYAVYQSNDRCVCVCGCIFVFCSAINAKTVRIKVLK